jgi:hypothetical protein
LLRGALLFASADTPASFLLCRNDVRTESERDMYATDSKLSSKEVARLFLQLSLSLSFGGEENDDDGGYICLTSALAFSSLASR